MIKIETDKLLIIIASFCCMMTLISTFLIKTMMLNSMKILLGPSLIETYKLMILSRYNNEFYEYIHIVKKRV